MQSQGIVWAYRAQRALLMARVGAHGRAPLQREALQAARRALELAEETARTNYPIERDFVRAHWLLGAALRVNGDATGAEQHLTEALHRCRRINVVDDEADILLDLARLRAAQGEGDHEGSPLREARRLAHEALAITERSGYVLQGADVHLFLAQQALAAGQRDEARQHATRALALARCDGPPHHYKVAWDEAEALLAAG